MKYCKHLNTVFSLIFLFLTILGIYILQTQRKSFFLNEPITEEMNKYPANIIDLRESIIEDILLRYDFLFDGYREIINKKSMTRLKLDVIPVSTLSISLILTKFKNCTKEFEDIIQSNVNMCANDEVVKDQKFIENFESNFDFFIEDQFKGQKYKVLNIIDSLVYDVEKELFLSFLFDSYKGNTKSPGFDSVNLNLFIFILIIYII
jgi:hypothetical protein